MACRPLHNRIFLAANHGSHLLAAAACDFLMHSQGPIRTTRGQIGRVLVMRGDFFSRIRTLGIDSSTSLPLRSRLSKLE